MAEISKLEAQVEIKSPVEKFYGFFRNNMHHLVQMLPKNINSFELLGEEDEIRAGSLTHWKYNLGSPMTAKVKIEHIDDEDMSIIFDVVQGDVLKFYKSFKAKIQVNKARKGADSVEWSLEFEKADEDSPDPEHHVDFAVKMSKGLDAYLCKN